MAVDCDNTAFAGEEQKQILSKYGDRIIPIKGRFGALPTLLAEKGIQQVDGILVDLGVSSPQLDNPERGFSFRAQCDGRTCFSFLFFFSLFLFLFFYFLSLTHTHRTARYANGSY